MEKQDFLSKIEKVYNSVLIILTIAMFVTVTYNVFMRFVINKSVGWADELSRFLFIWMSFLGAVLAYRYDEHVGLNFVVDKIKNQSIRRIIAVFRQVLVIILLGFLAWYGYLASTTVMNVSPALSIPMSIIYLIVPFCGFLMLIIGIIMLVNQISGSEIDFSARNSVE